MLYPCCTVCCVVSKLVPVTIIFYTVLRSQRWLAVHNKCHVGGIHQFHVGPQSNVFATVISANSSQVQFNKDIMMQQL